MIKELIKRALKYSGIALTKNQRYDQQTEQIFKNKLKASSNCIDVGCHQGEILDLMMTYAPEGLHFGLEPIPEFYHALEKKYKNFDSCTILNYAASNEKGLSSFNYVVSNPAYSGLRKRDYDQAGEEDMSIEVQTERLDVLIPGNIEIDLIKIDVEGAELLVLEGARKLIKKHQPLVIFEHGLGASDHYGTGPQEIFQYFSEQKMFVNTMRGFLKKSAPFTQDRFQSEYYQKRNYYFIAFP
jgi:FkbM family methyltransferase